MPLSIDKKKIFFYLAIFILLTTQIEKKKNIFLPKNIYLIDNSN